MPHGRSRSGVPGEGQEHGPRGRSSPTVHSHSRENMINTDIPNQDKASGMLKVRSYQSLIKQSYAGNGHDVSENESPASTKRPIADVNDADDAPQPARPFAMGAVDTALRCRIRRTKDVMWQENPPRVLKYRTSHLHYWGYIPGLIPRNLRATVFASPYLHMQTAFLLIWCGIIHGTGLGLPKAYLNTFVMLFGTNLLGGTFNVTLMQIFIQGLFVTLVINRWWQIRSLYAKVHSVTVDLAITASSFIQPPLSGNAAPEKVQMMKRARAKLARYLNLGHILTVVSADAQSKHFPVTKGLRHAIRQVKDCLGDSGTPAGAQGPAAAAAVAGAGDQDATGDEPTFGKGSARDIGMEDLYHEGLVTLDEWELIEQSTEIGLPQYLLPYQWCMRLVQACVAHDLMQNGPQAAAMIQAKLSALIENCASIFTAINSQLPYPYVALVSVGTHFYLFTLATWFGALFYGGFPNTVGRLNVSKLAVAKDFCETTTLPQVVCLTLFGPADAREAGKYTIALSYFLLAFANVVCQGFLDIHTITDNLCGNGPAPFPLRAQIVSLINCTGGILAMSNTFGSRGVADKGSKPAAGAPQPDAAAPGGAGTEPRTSATLPQRVVTEQQRERQWQADTLGITENQPGPQPLWKTDMEHTPSGAKHPQSISVVGKTSTEALKAQILRGRDSESRKD